MKKVKVVIIGAGSGSFGRGILADLFSSQELKETDLTVGLVDINPQALDRMFRFAQLLKDYYGSRAKIEASTDRKEVLPSADYVITAVAQRRYEFWDMDFYIPLAYGFKHIFGECGGPGAAFHTLRSLHLIIPICKDMEKLCPSALLLNFTNPENRVTLGVYKLTRIKAVGLCHGPFMSLDAIADVLGRGREEIDITIAGLNHFHWVLSIRDAQGEDLYPLFRQKIEENPSLLPPLALKMFQLYDLLPFPADSHIGEYVSYAYEICGPIYPGAREGLMRGGWEINERIRRIVDGEEPLTVEMAIPSGELAIPIICAIEWDKKERVLGVNIPNEGAITNLPPDAIVEIPARVDKQGVHPEKVGALPEPIAEMCRRQITIQNLLILAYKERSKKLLLQALSLEPVVDDLVKAKEMMEVMLNLQREALPEFA